MEIITKQRAESLGLARFFNGVPCKAGHVAERYVRGGRCVVCALQWSSKQDKKPSRYNPEGKRLYYQQNRATIRAKADARRAMQLGITLEEYLARRDARVKAGTPEAKKERKRQEAKRDYQRNPDRYRAHAELRKARNKRQTPSWASLSEMRKFYRLAEKLTRETGIEHHVDHIVPMVSPIVCGLHCQHNLQVITAEENLRKSNKFSPDDYTHELP